MEGSLDALLSELQGNTTAPDVDFANIEIGSVRLRLLAAALETNTSCFSIDLSRRGLLDDDGPALKKALSNNSTLERIDLSSNMPWSSIS